MAMSNIIQFLVSKEDSAYTAEGVNIPVVTEGDTFEELTKNIKEAVELFFEGDNPTTLGFGPMPSILTSFELSPVLYGHKA